MDGIRRISHVLLGAWGAGWIAGAVLVWGFGLSGTVPVLAVLLAMMAGGVLAIGGARRLPKLTPRERRDAVLGWGFLLGFVATAACFLAPMPWALVAAVTVGGGTALALRAYARANPVD